MLRLVFFGGGAFAATVLRRLASVHQLCLAVASPPWRGGRKMRLRPSPFAVCAEKLNLNIMTRADVALVRQQRPDALIVCDYGTLLAADFLTIARLGALNVHPSLLPRWRGAAPVERAILAGDEKTGVSIMRLNANLDAGDVLAQHEVAITPQTTGGDLRLSLAETGADLLLRVLANTDAFPPRRQQAALVTYAEKIRPRERLLDFSQSAAAVLRQVAAFAPQPCAHCFLLGARVKVHEAAAVAGCGDAGLLLAANDDGIVVACGDGALQIKQLQKAGGEKMSAADFLRGFPLAHRVGKIAAD